MFPFSSRARLFGVLALASIVHSQQLLIDDTDTSALKYSENPNGPKWGPFANGGEQLSLTLANGTMMPIDATPCYNHSYTYAACNTANNCQLEIPFNGSGITIYVYQAGAEGINASFQIDNGATTVNSLNAPPGPTEIANVSIFNTQSLPSGNHTLTLMVLDWAGTFSGMMFDYAAINQTFVAPPPTTTSSASTSATSSAAPTGTTNGSTAQKSGINIGAVVGGAVAGVAVVTALIFAILYFRRRNNKPAATSHANHPATPFDTIPFTSTPFDPTPSVLNSTITRTTTSIPFTDHPTASTPFLSSTSPPSSPPSSKFAQNMALANPSVSILSPSGTQTTSGRSHPPSPPHPTHELASSPSAMRENLSLTDEQADFVHSLYNNNVPAPAIARVMERMIADRGPHTRAANNNRLTDDFSVAGSLPPPGYYDVPN